MHALRAIFCSNIKSLEHDRGTAENLKIALPLSKISGSASGHPGKIGLYRVIIGKIELGSSQAHSYVIFVIRTLDTKSYTEIISLLSSHLISPSTYTVLS